MTYTFFINTASSVVYQVYPLNWLDCTLVDEKEEGQVYYRRKFQGSLTFGGKKLCEDFNLFYSIEINDPCELIYILILQDTDIYWEGYFSTSMGQWDLDNQTFTVTPLSIDDYSDFSVSGDVEYNIIDLTNGLAEITTHIVVAGLTTHYTRNRYVIDVIEYLGRKIAGNLLTVSSTFLNEATNPVIQAANHYNYLTIAQKSDIKRPGASDYASVGMLSFNGLMKLLRCLNLRWTYDSTTHILTVEHISHWDSAVAGLDIRTVEMAYSTNKYRYINERMPKYETFKWMEANNTDFVGEKIWYDSTCVNQDSKSNTEELALDVTTDIEYIYESVNATGDETLISDKGWVLLANEMRTGDLYIYLGDCILQAGASLYNIDLSWSVLHRNFWKHDRQLIEGYMNDDLTTFYTAKKIKEQECSIIYCYDLDPEQYITTELGETYFGGEKAEVRKATIKPYGEINFILNYGPVSNPVVPIVYAKTIKIVEVAVIGLKSTFYATCSEPADADLSITIYFENKNDVGGLCNSDVGTITILTGQYTGSVIVFWCDPDYICITHYYPDDSGAPGWEVTWEYDDDTHCPV